jgi:hypothetical protein
VSDGYDGFCIDLLKEMSQMLNFTFEIIEVEDGAYGVEVGPITYDQSLLFLGCALAVVKRHFTTTFTALIIRKRV